MLPSAQRDAPTAQALNDAHAAHGIVRNDLLVCEDCDAVHQRPRLARRDLARCRRCGATLARGAWLTLDGQLAVALAAAVVFVIASASPIVTLTLRGVSAEASLWQATLGTWRSGEHLVAVLAALTAFVFPLIVIALRLWVLTALLLRPLLPGRAAIGVAHALRALHWAARWSMVEVFMLGILVAVVRSVGVTDVVLGAGIFAYAALTVLITAMQASSLHTLWARLPLAGASSGSGAAVAPVGPKRAAQA